MRLDRGAPRARELCLNTHRGKDEKKCLWSEGPALPIDTYTSRHCVVYVSCSIRNHYDSEATKAMKEALIESGRGCAGFPVSYFSFKRQSIVMHGF